MVAPSGPQGPPFTKGPDGLLRHGSWQFTRRLLTVANKTLQRRTGPLVSGRCAGVWA